MTGRAWVVPSQVRVVPEPKHITFVFPMSPNFPYFSLPQKQLTFLGSYLARLHWVQQHISMLVRVLGCKQQKTF
jgi:hypothetical protein